jgi:hypothetical protein
MHRVRSVERLSSWNDANQDGHAWCNELDYHGSDE